MELGDKWIGEGDQEIQRSSYERHNSWDEKHSIVNIIM